MSEINQVMNNIKKAIENTHRNPIMYRKKILSYIFDLKEEYHHSDSEFFNIVKETFKLHPTNFLKYIYNRLTDKVGKLYGKKKKRDLEMTILDPDFIDTLPPEHFTDWLFKQLEDKRNNLYEIWVYDDLADKIDNKEVNEIKTILGKKITASVLKKELISYLISKKVQHLSTTGSNNLIREVFRINPKFFLKWVYDDLMKNISKVYGIEKRKDIEKIILDKQFITHLFNVNPLYFRKNLHDNLTEKMENFYGIQKSREIEKEIIQKNCLYNGEQILYDFKGVISQREKIEQWVSVSGNIFITNFRIIADGSLHCYDLKKLLPYNLKVKDAIINTAAHREFPFYGYIFPIKTLYDLKKKTTSINYKVKINKQIYLIILKIKSPPFKKVLEENVNKLYEILKMEEERGE
ncbi:MAG: hypothetical protein ACFFFT_11635 [Candidatus Thorarchaeota archaeon]